MKGKDAQEAESRIHNVNAESLFLLLLVPVCLILQACFAGTEMCRRRPLVVKAGDWEHRFDIGQYAWFLSHDRYRRYEVAVPAECLDATGRCDLELSVPEPANSPYLREVRLEVEG